MNDHFDYCLSHHIVLIVTAAFYSGILPRTCVLSKRSEIICINTGFHYYISMCHCCLLSSKRNREHNIRYAHIWAWRDLRGLNKVTPKTASGWNHEPERVNDVTLCKQHLARIAILLLCKQRNRCNYQSVFKCSRWDLSKILFVM